MNFVNFQQLYDDVLVLERKVPDVDAVLGVPRSGMLPATMFAAIRNIPLGVADGKPFVFLHGVRRIQDRTPVKVLVLDDSYDLGTAMDAVRERMKGVVFEIIYAAVYVSASDALVDAFARVLPTPRLFAWNVMNNGKLGDVCVDFDGVLCYNPSEPIGNDEPRLLDFVRTATPKHRPLYQVHSIVTGRPEVCRGATEEWLSRYGYQFGALAMYPNFEKTQEYNAIHFKAEYYKNSSCILFIESEEVEAKGIAQLSGKPVLCLDTMTLYDNP